ncbi:oxygenase MpaB family protein [Actinomadura fibrosa]|uniref:Oxygenase MpaB family protein n=1 Tax=Actinomadura fibrosa TaxID=111802 RepID=A0ABW2Y0P9_9ACTN|nr:oxygenase MpaB family protein [Actinomadura fibrosa]
MSDRTRWSQEEFARLRQTGDDQADAAVKAYLHAHRDLGDARALIRAVIGELAAAKHSARAAQDTAIASPSTGLSPSAVPTPSGFAATDGASAGHARNGAQVSSAADILDKLATNAEVPSWVGDAVTIERGQRVFRDHGLYQAVVLFCLSLPLAYAEPSTARLLAGVSDLGTGAVTRRVAETGQMLIDVMGLGGPDSLRHGGPGHTSCVALRVLHAFVRAIVSQDAQRPWDRETDGVPVSQELLLATLLTFSSVTWQAMDRMGLRLGDIERDAHLHVWSVVGHLMGIQACWHAPLTGEDSAALEAHFAQMLHTSEQGRRLMAALLADMESFMYLGWRKLPRTLIHWLFHGSGPGMEGVPAMLGVPAPAWWALPLLATARAAHRGGRRDPLRPVIRWLLRRAGRYAVIGFAERHTDGPAPFQVPADLARSWQIAQTPSARRLRAVRRRARQTVRSRNIDLRDVAGRASRTRHTALPETPAPATPPPTVRGA